MFTALALAPAGCASGDESSPASSPDHTAADRRLDRRLEQLDRDVARHRREQAREASEGTVSALPGFEAFARGLPGAVGATIGVPGDAAVLGGGELRPGVAWSTIKVPLVLRTLEDAGGPEGLSSDQRALIERAITASDNDAAAALFDSLAAEYGGPEAAARAVTEVLREAGDEKTEVSSQGRDGFSPYGQTEWLLPAQHRFMSALAGGCVGSTQSAEYVLDLMGRVTSDTWGLGSAGVPARWKGGWGPGVDGRYLVRQMGVISADAGDVVVTLAVRPDDGQFASGQSIATEVARWLADAKAPAADGAGICDAMDE